MEFFDSHCHLDDERFDEDREKIIAEIKKADITKFISAGYSVESSIKGVALSKVYDYIYTTCGISPNDIPQNEEKLWKDIEKIRALVKDNIKDKKIIAIGEIGLDYYWEKDLERRKLQKQAFIKQIEIANTFNLPIVIHTREAVMDTLEVLKDNTVERKGVFHCCPLNRELVKEALKLGFYISFAGPVTFKNSKNANEIIEMVPEDKMLIETDSPYLAPEPVRGTRNDPRNVKYIAQKIADVKGKTIEEIAKTTYTNVEKIFNI